MAVVVIAAIVFLAGMAVFFIDDARRLADRLEEMKMVKSKTQLKGVGPVREHRSKDNQWFYTVNARNGQVLVTSETYKTKAAMLKGIKALRRAMEG